MDALVIFVSKFVLKREIMRINNNKPPGSFLERSQRICRHQNAPQSCDISTRWVIFVCVLLFLGGGGGVCFPSSFFILNLFCSDRKWLGSLRWYVTNPKKNRKKKEKKKKGFKQYLNILKYVNS